MIGNIIRAVWCQTFHWAYRQFVGTGSFYCGEERRYGEMHRCRLCGREWVVTDA